MNKVDLISAMAEKSGMTKRIQRKLLCLYGDSGRNSRKKDKVQLVGFALEGREKCQKRS